MADDPWSGGDLPDASAFDDRARGLLSSVGSAVAAADERFAARVGSILAGMPELADLLERLGPDQRSDLFAGLGRHFRTLTDPGVDQATFLRRAERLGRMFAHVGIELSSYVNAVVTYEHDIGDAIEHGVEAALAIDAAEVVHRRVTIHERTVFSAAGAVEETQDRVLLEVSRVTVEAETLTDLVRDVMAALVTLDGVVFGTVGRIDDDGTYEFELIDRASGDRSQEPGGAGREPLHLVVPDSGPAARAWRTGEIVRSDFYLQDASTTSLHARAAQLGWQSNVAVPICDHSGEAWGIMALHATEVQYFAPERRRQLLEQVRALVEEAYLRIQRGVHDVSRRAHVFDRSRLIGLLERGGLTMLYQPIVALPGGEVLQFEALARLDDDGHLLEPAEYLGAFGEAELFAVFAEGVDQALANLRVWQQAGLSTSVSVNIPATCSADTRCVEVVREALGRHRVAPERLIIEVLENTLFDADPVRHLQVLEEFQSMGVRLSEDDLGAGYSSLLRLRNVAFEQVKIDQGLVLGAQHPAEEALRFIHPLSELSKSMGKRVIVEGLGSTGLLEAAILLGADAGQGHAIAAPMPGASVPDWAASFRIMACTGRPTTVIGGLASHLAWEYRMDAVGRTRPGAPDGPVPASSGCGLDDVLAALEGTSGALVGLHATLHEAAARDPHGDLHRRSWEQLTLALVAAGG